MGYTHYWDLKQAPTDTQMEMLVDVFENIKSYITANKVPADCYKGEIVDINPENGWHDYYHFDEGDTEKVIAFNGDRGKGFDHETFLLSQKEMGFQFCKTAAKPYDAVVVAMLLALKAILQDGVRVSSDGTEEDLELGAILLAKATKKPIKFTFENGGDGEEVKILPISPEEMATLMDELEVNKPELKEVT